MSKDERIKGLIDAVNRIADMLEWHTEHPSIINARLEAEDAVRAYGDPLDAQRGMLFDTPEEASAEGR